MQSTNIK